jgi:hypothetical protein
MSLILSGTDGLSDVDGSAATPAIRGTDANTGIFFPAADTIAFAEGGAEVARFDSAGNFGLGTTTPSFPSGTGLAIFNTSVPRLKFTNSTTGDTSTDGTNLLVSGSDFYIQQREAASVFISTNGTNAVTVDSGGGFKVLNTIGVGNTTPSTSGVGITFPATQSASSDANTLDDYEEGTFSPTITFGGGSTGVAYSDQKGTYVKVGGNVFINVYLRLSSKGSSTGQVAIAGFPFATASGIDFFAPLAPRGYVNSGGNPVSIYAGSGGITSFLAYSCNLTGSTNASLTDTAIASNTEFNFNFWYKTSA